MPERKDYTPPQERGKESMLKALSDEYKKLVKKIELPPDDISFSIENGNLRVDLTMLTYEEEEEWGNFTANDISNPEYIRLNDLWNKRRDNYSKLLERVLASFGYDYRMVDSNSERGGSGAMYTYKLQERNDVKS